jgi:hypothetical protein
MVAVPPKKDVCCVTQIELSQNAGTKGAPSGVSSLPAKPSGPFAQNGCAISKEKELRAPRGVTAEAD